MGSVPVSSAPIPSPMGSNLPSLNLGPSPIISSASIGGPPPIPTLGPGVIGPQSLSIPLSPIISIPSLHLPPVPTCTIHSSQHTATILSTTSTASSSLYQQQQQQQPPPQHRIHSTGCTTTVNTLSASGMMTTHVTHSLTTPGVSPSGNLTANAGKLSPISHSCHARSKESPSITLSTPISTVMSVTALTTTTTVTTTTTSTNPQHAFVRPFEDSFRSTTKPLQRNLTNNHQSQIITNHQTTQDSMMKTYVSIAPSITNQITETSCKDSISKTRIDSNHQHQMVQPIPYPPPFHHPHIPVTHVPSLYKPPHFSSPPVHHQHHQSSKLNLSTTTTPNSNGNIETNSNANIGNLSTKIHTQHTSESRESSNTLRNEHSSSVNNNEGKIAPSANYYLNHVPPNSKMFNTQNNNNPEKENKEIFEKTREKQIEKENEIQNRIQEHQNLSQNHILNQEQSKNFNHEHNQSQIIINQNLNINQNSNQLQQIHNQINSNQCQITMNQNQITNSQNQNLNQNSNQKQNLNHSQILSKNQIHNQSQSQILNQNHNINQNGSQFNDKIVTPQAIFEPLKENLCEKESKKEIDLNNYNNEQNSVMFTLPFQPKFKFGLNENVTQKPIDTAQLMQSIKSEEVLRTCQNVSNVLLQIPKYQEKLLNFSQNELKTTAFCITDKCNNLTEISMKYEPAVLNVPDVSKALVKKEEDESEKFFCVPESPKKLRSSLDLAEKRRKRKREKNNGATTTTTTNTAATTTTTITTTTTTTTTTNCHSESEDDETKEIDLWITKGPPSKPQYSDEKLAFLAMFGLTTLSIKNEMELYKVEKRYRLNPDPPEPPLEIEPALESALPIPREHPDVLLHSTDFVPKVGFLKNIGLDIMPPSKRDEAEITWQYILQDRKKRKSMNTVTAYCDRIAKVYSNNPPSAPKPPQRMRLLDKIKVKHIPERPPPLPPLVPNIVSTYYPILPMPGENGVKHYKFSEINNDDADDTASDNSDNRPKWNGIEDVIQAYKDYQKEKAMEKKILSVQTSKLVAQTNSLRSEAMQLERRWYELVDLRTSLDSEKRVLSQKIERINALVRALR